MSNILSEMVLNEFMDRVKRDIAIKKTGKLADKFDKNPSNLLRAKIEVENQRRADAEANIKRLDDNEKRKEQTLDAKQNIIIKSAEGKGDKLANLAKRKHDIKLKQLAITKDKVNTKASVINAKNNKNSTNSTVKTTNNNKLKNAIVEKIDTRRDIVNKTEEKTAMKPEREKEIVAKA
jgi:hypothetical protein